MVDLTGLEPVATRLQTERSTAELQAHDLIMPRPGFEPGLSPEKSMRDFRAGVKALHAGPSCARRINHLVAYTTEALKII